VIEVAPIRVLFLSDTHLGFDLPFKPRIERRRRGHDFFANFERALEPAFTGNVDIVLHGGDLLYRTKVPAALVEMAMRPLVRVAESGVPVFIVPGNHERSRIPLHLWGTHPNLKIFDEPKTYQLKVRGSNVAIAGLPFQRNVRDQFSSLVKKTDYIRVDADIRILCIHEAVEGAQVGPSNFTFRRGLDVIPGNMIPGGFSAVLSGHIHRSQILTHDLRGLALATPVIYSGSIERTSFAEQDENKNYVLLDFVADGSEGGKLSRYEFVDLPARPMISINVQPEEYTRQELEAYLRAELSTLDPDAIVRLRIEDEITKEVAPVLSAPALRELAPPTMNISISLNQGRRNS
jgi:DNA repair exonuclease SbcCD nuclease subunit